MRFLRRTATGAVLFVFALSCRGAASQPDLWQTCDRAAATAAAESGVPLAVLRAITRTETGRGRDGQVQPWPWTVNMEGKGRWFDSPDAAKSYVYKHYNQGARSFDVGCFQINYRWHGTAFASIEDMFDPVENARYAADFLGRLYRETGDWSRAAGAFHSRTPVHAARYRKIFDRHFATMRHAAPPPRGAPETAKRPVLAERAVATNRYPLLRAGEPRHAGSLVPGHPSEGAPTVLLDLGRSGSPIW